MFRAMVASMILGAATLVATPQDVDAARVRVWRGPYTSGVVVNGRGVVRARGPYGGYYGGYYGRAYRGARYRYGTPYYTNGYYGQPYGYPYGQTYYYRTWR